jgi:ribosomal protein S14
MSNLSIQDQKRRTLVQQYELLRKQLKSIFYNTNLPNEIRQEAQAQLNALPRNSSSVRVRNRCVYTGRGRAVYQDFKMSRITFRELCSNGQIPGMKKSSW